MSTAHHTLRTTLIVAVLGMTSLAYAKPPSPEARAAEIKTAIETGIRCYGELNYGCTIDKLTGARAAIDGEGVAVAAADRVAMLRTLAFALASVERHDEAVRVFSALLRVAPSTRMDPNVVSPKIMADFNRARRNYLAQLAPIPVAPVALPEPFIPDGPGVSDMELHVPEELRLASRVRTDDEITHSIGFEGGAGLLFGADADNFGTGFSVGLTYSYELTKPLQIGARVGFAQHGTSRTDVKAGHPSQLLMFYAGPELRVVLELGDYVELGFGVSPSLHMSGVGDLSGKVGAMVVGSITVMARPVSEIGIGVAVLPSVVISGTDGGTGSSFVLPLALRLEGGF